MQWYPGHMAKTKRQIDEVKKDVDLFINVLDSRIPRTSFNHHLVDLIGKKTSTFSFNSETPERPC
ncbi:hypothetical protein [Mycoplasma sp. ATU-Cv-508]|uniref:hypothetical protein n=1 Tax=Mycoplasma sp. ATU-Cv-508 TaxID=2048001 RepID=UPI000FDEF920